MNRIENGWRSRIAYGFDRPACAESSFVGRRPGNPLSRLGAKSVAEKPAAVRVSASRFTRRSFAGRVRRGGFPSCGRVEVRARRGSASSLGSAVGARQRLVVRPGGPSPLRRVGGTPGSLSDRANRRALGNGGWRRGRDPVGGALFVAVLRRRGCQPVDRRPIEPAFGN